MTENAKNIELLPVYRVAQLLRLGVPKVKKAMQNGEIPCRIIDGKYYSRIDWLQDLTPRLPIEKSKSGSRKDKKGRGTTIGDLQQKYLQSKN